MGDASIIGVRQRAEGHRPAGAADQVDRWAGCERVVRVRPHVWRWLQGHLDGSPVLELGPGLRPTVPAARGTFVEVSPHARKVLGRNGARTLEPEAVPSLPGSAFGAALAFEVLEHIEEDDAVVAEVARILSPGGTFLLSTPIHRSRWSPLDEACGHVRRYEPEALFRLLERHGLRVEGFVPGVTPLRRTAGVQARMMRRNPVSSTRAAQRLAFPVQAAFHRLFGRLRWRPPGTAVPRRSDDILVWARKA